MKTEQELRAILGINVKNRREHLNWSQEKLAEKTGVTRNTICDIEAGDKFARARTLVKLAMALDTQVYELFKPDGILPDKPIDIFTEFSEEVKESMVQIRNSYLKKMKR